MNKLEYARIRVNKDELVSCGAGFLYFALFAVAECDVSIGNLFEILPILTECQKQLNNGE